MPVTHICERCGKKFQTYPSSRGRFCGKECSGPLHRRHGVSLTQEYAVWKHMRNRCNNPNCRDYARYGGRGITIDPRWEVYENFREDMGPRPSKMHSIERSDNNRGYGPDNCKWATRKEQAQNRNFCWTPEEDEKLRQAVAQGCNFAEAGRLIGKSEMSASARARRIGLTSNYNPHAPRSPSHPSTVRLPGHDETMANLDALTISPQVRGGDRG